jgi:hypothetical protein
MRTFTMNPWGEQPIELVVHTRNYSNGRTAIELIDAEDNMPYAVATVNLPDVLLAENEVLIKDYSENEGVLDFLVHNKIVRDTGRGVQSGFVWIPVCELLPKSEWGCIDPPPDQIDLDRGKSMWEIKGYKIWAYSYKEALEMLPLIESF